MKECNIYLISSLKNIKIHLQSKVNDVIFMYCAEYISFSSRIGYVPKKYKFKKYKVKLSFTNGGF